MSVTNDTLAQRRSELDARRTALPAHKQRVLDALLKRGAEAAVPARVIPVCPPDVSAPLSFAQERLWFLDQLEPGTTAYNVCVPFRITGRLNVCALTQSVNEMIRRQETLRTTFVAVDGKPVQLLSPWSNQELPLVDLEPVPAAARDEVVQQLIADAVGRPFDLANGPLLRTNLLRLANEDHLLLLTLHHISLDEWSMRILLHDTAQLYKSFAQGESSPLEELPIQYRDFAHWQRQWLQGDVLKAELDFWRKQLEGSPSALTLPTDRPRSTVTTWRAETAVFELSPELSDGLNDLTEAAGTTPFTTFLAAFQLLLSRYTGQYDIPIGTPVHGRRWIETEGVIGFFVNTLVLRTKLDGNPSIREVLNRVRETSLEAQTHQDLPFEKLVEELQPERSLSHTPLFQVMFGFQNAPKQRETIPGLTVSLVEVKNVTAKFDLTLSMAEGEQGITGELEYNADLFNPATIDRMIEHFRTLLEAMVDDPDQRLTDVELLSAAERRQILVEWNETETGYAREQCLAQIFEAQVERSPDSVALVCEDQQLTYRQLNRRANQLAHYLQELGVGPETRVGLNLKRTPHAIIAMLAVLKAGGAYFAQDVGQPRERLLFMLEDCGVRFLLTEPELADELSAASLQVIALSNEWERINKFSAENPAAHAVPENLACLIYTSGSTGKPKGAMLTHGCLAFYARAGARIYDITAADRGLQFASLGVDGPIEEIYPCLTQGGTLFLRDEEMMASARDFLSRCGQLGITFLSMPTAWFHVLTAGKSMSEWWDLATDMRLVCFGGEAVLPERVGELLAATGERVRLVNGYGPTETTVCATSGEYDRNHSTEEIGIGRPLPNAQVYIVGESLRAAPVGVTGELLIGGDGVARGYLSRPDLTAEKFIPNPFAAIAGERVYRTGDQVRYLPDGNIEFFGRQDHQVKIRGFRIETGEIEAVLRTHPAVKDAVVMAREERPGDKRLVGYVVWNDGTEDEAGIGALRKYLKDKLPSHMMPSFFVTMAEFPLTAYRKVDRPALPKPQGLAEWNQLYVAPRTPVEEMLVGIWANVLGVDQVGIEDNFFEIGGHSLLATQLISRVRETFGVELPLRALFEQATIAGLAERVEQLWRGGPSVTAQPLSAVDRSQALPLSFAQQRLWFLDQLDPGSPLYNIPEAVWLLGAIDTHALESSLDELIHRHESLRTRFVAEQGGSTQVVSDHVPFKLVIEDLSPLDEESRRVELRRLLNDEAETGFDLAIGPLLRVRLFRMSETEHVLAATMHHIISDEWSMEILRREISVLYDAFSSGAESPLPELRLQYADYAVWQRERLQGEALERELRYWRRQLAGAPAVIELPTDRARPAVQTHRGAYQRVRFDAVTTRGLKELGRRQNATLFMTVLAGFQALLSRWSGTTDVVVGTPVAGRTQGETESVIGFFVNTLALRTDLSGNPAFGELLQRVREVCLGAYAHQEVPFEKLVEELGVERDLSRTPLFQVMLAWQTATAEEPELRGLQMVRVEEDLSRSRAKFDLLLSLGEFGGQIVGTLEYNVDLYDAATIERLARHLERVMAAVAEAEECCVGELPLLSDAEREQVVVEWNRRTPYPVSGSVIARFERESERRPEAIAVKFDEEEVSYGELNRRANQLGHYLRRRGVGPEVRVGLLLNRSVEMVVSVLAVLKAGGAYVPLELAAPAERIAFALEDSGCELLLTTKDVEPTPALDSKVVLDEAWRAVAAEPETNLAVAVDEENAAYVIYTSGSTGKPKGVMVTHGNVLRLLDATDHWFGFGSEDVWTMFHSYAFDFSVWELWGALLYGGRLVVVPYWVSRSPDAYYELLQREQVTVLNQTPSAFRQLQPLLEETPVDRLRAVIFGGEALELSSLRSWYERYGEDGPQMVNMYGITETTVHVTYRLLGPADVTSGRSSLIGRRIPDLELYLLDERQEPAPVGVAGELYVGGGGVARGYLKRAELTAERFIPHPFSSEAGARLYRTGDLGRYLADGDIEYLGRVDQQVKIRGYRIETGEVAAALRSHEAVAEAVVVASSDDGGEQRLVGYVVPRPGVELQVAELRSHLRERLPDYMVPAYLVELDALPLTANGKLDRRRLPAPQTEALSGSYQAPGTPVEEKLAAVWAQVLGTDRVGVTDNFFALGGDSIRSVRVVALAREEGLQFSLQQLFQYQTIQELAAVLSESETREQLPRSEPFSLLRSEDRERLGPEVEDAYPLSMLQAGMLFHSEFERDSTLYHNWSSYHVRAPFDEAALREAIDRLLQRHAVLRTAFDLTSYSEPLQLVQRQATAPFAVDDISQLSVAEQEAVIAAWQETERRRYLDWRVAPLLRFQVHRRSAETFQFSFAEHHAILDGWSVAAMLTDLFSVYLALLNGEAEIESVAARSTFRDFVALEQEALRSEECRQYWRESLSGSRASSLPRWSTDEPTGVHILPVPVAAEVSDQLKQVAETAGTPIKSVLLAAHLRVMSLLNGQPEVLTGVASHGRPEAIDAERVLGLYLNTLPFRLRLAGGSWLELIKEIFAGERKMLPHRYYPLAQIKLDEGGRPLFDTIFNFTHFRVLDVFNTATGIDVLDQSGFAETDFALAVDFSLNTGDSQINLQLTGTALSREQLEAIAGYYSAALHAIAADPHARYDQQPLLSADELQRLLVEWNNTAAPYEREACVHQLFEQQVERTPDAIAVEFGDIQFTYQELNDRANQLAHYLRECGVGAEVPVGICLQRSAEMIVALLAILKAGGAYLPLDVDYPAERLSFMMADVGATVLITQGDLQQAPAEQQTRLVILDRDRELINRYSKQNLSAVTTPQNLAYIIYTSGSTGLPKGSGITLRSINRLVRNTNYLRFSAAEVIAQVSNSSFDAATFEVWGALLNGGRLQGISREVLLTPPAFEAALKTQGVTAMFLTTALFNQMVRHNPGSFATMSHLLVGGDKVDVDAARTVLQCGAAPARLVNGYGPTEATTFAVCHEISRLKEGAETVPIGSGIANTDLYVLDHGQQPVPVMTKGELYIGGDGLARGYLNRPELTAEKFVPHPFSATPGERLYRTGDVTRWNTEGVVECLGRVDHQVKIRGFRIETGEVETALSANEKVREAVVIVREDAPGEKRLVAYVACDPDVTIGDLRTYLRERMPDYMIPSYFVLLADLPLNANGKVDRSALPEPQPDEAVSSEAYVAPRTPTEQAIAAIWARVLGMERVGINDNFFDLGGHSLLATQLISRIREDFALEMPLVHLFENPTVAELAQIVESIRWLSQDQAFAAAAGQEYEEGEL